MNTLSSFRQRGISLIESLVALVVISVGALSIASLHSNLIASSGLSKARSEAVQLAQGNNEQLRNLIEWGQYDTRVITDSREEPIHGINAEFTLSWTVSAGTNDNYKTLSTTVTWTDAKEGPQTMTQSTQVAWVDPMRTVAATYRDANMAGLPTPQGRAERPGPNVELIDREQAKDDGRAFEQPDGLTILISEDGKEVQLVDAEDNIILVMRPSTSGQGFSTISGRVYIDKAHALGTGTTQVDRSKVMTLSSTEGECTRIFDPNGEQPYTLFETTHYHYYEYRCYVGEGWYGNTGIVRLDGAHNSHRVCVGDPNVTGPAADSTLWSNRLPALDSVRKYRGYRELGTDTEIFRAVGIGLNPTVPGYTATGYENHHFLLTPITGNTVDNDCRSPLEKDSTHFASNPGRNFCMTTTCPGEPEPEEPITFLQGRITSVSGTDEEGNQVFPRLATLQIDSGECTLVPDGNDYTYTCETRRSGWTGSTWSDYLNLIFEDPAAENELCITKTGTAADYTTIDVDGSRAFLQNIPVVLLEWDEDGELILDNDGNEIVLDLELNLVIGYSAAQCPQPVTTTIGVTITRHAQNVDHLPTVTLVIDQGSCTQASVSNAAYTYNCVIRWIDFPAGSSWTGYLNLGLSGNAVLCTSGASGTAGGVIMASDRKIGFNWSVPSADQTLTQQVAVASQTQRCP